MNQKMSAWAEADTVLAELQDNIAQAKHEDAVALKAAAIAGEPDPGTANSDAAARAVLYQEQVAVHARGELTKAGTAVRQSLEENKLTIIEQSTDKAELGALAWQDGMLKLQADYYRLVEERAQSQDGMKMVSKLGLTSPLVTFEGSFPVSGQLTVPIIREERLLGIIETIRKVVLDQTTETGEFNKLFYGSA